MGLDYAEHMVMHVLCGHTPCAWMQLSLTSVAKVVMPWRSWRVDYHGRVIPLGNRCSCACTGCAGLTFRLDYVNEAEGEIRAIMQTRIRSIFLQVGAHETLLMHGVTSWSLETGDAKSWIG